MWPYHPDLLARPVPRYTSYPTAAEFGPVDRAFHAEGLERLAPDAAVSLYAHIPYCERICWYCGCNTGAANRSHRLSAYLDALHAEIDLVAARLGRGRPVGQIAFGGGSPNAIPPVDFVRLLDHLVIAFDAPQASVSVELDPRSLTPAWTAALGRVGVARASLGVQTFEPDLQVRIGRIQPAEDVERAVEGLRAGGVGSINFDLMYGLPGQDERALAATLERTIALAPERIALFGYAHLPERIPRQRQIDGSGLPGPRERFAIAALGHRMLVGAGYVPIGFDHFALPGDPLARAAAEERVRRNFQGFTDDGADALIGLGASAISSLPDRFVQVEKNSGRYRMLAGSGLLAGARGIRRSPDDLARGHAIEALLCRGEARPGAALLERAAPALAPFVERGLATIEGSALRLTEAGRPYARAIASLFDAHRDPAGERFSQAV